MSGTDSLYSETEIQQLLMATNDSLQVTEATCDCGACGLKRQKKTEGVGDTPHALCLLHRSLPMEKIQMGLESLNQVFVGRAMMITCRKQPCTLKEDARISAWIYFSVHLRNSGAWPVGEQAWVVLTSLELTVLLPSSPPSCWDFNMCHYTQWHLSSFHAWCELEFSQRQVFREYKCLPVGLRALLWKLIN